MISCCATCLQDTAARLAIELDAVRCECGGWQCALWCPETAMLVIYCGGCGATMREPIDVWPEQGVAGGPKEFKNSGPLRIE